MMGGLFEASLREEIRERCADLARRRATERNFSGTLAESSLLRDYDEQRSTARTRSGHAA